MVACLVGRWCVSVVGQLLAVAHFAVAHKANEVSCSKLFTWLDAQILQANKLLGLCKRKPYELWLAGLDSGVEKFGRQSYKLPYFAVCFKCSHTGPIAGWSVGWLVNWLVGW